jgi:hypothetical protein
MNILFNVYVISVMRNSELVLGGSLVWFS